MKKKFDTEEDFESSPMWLPYYEKTQSKSVIEVVLDEPLRESAYYRNVLNRLNNASEEDVVIIRLAGPGGSAVTLQHFVNAIWTTEAFVVAVVDGEIASAHSLIMLACDEVILLPIASAMFHDYSGGAGGKGGETIDSVMFTQKHLHGFFETLCEGFLTPEEMKLLYIGKDFYFSRDELETRLEAKQEYMKEKEEQDSLEALILEEPEPKPVLKTKKSKSTPKPEYDPKEVAFKND
jgi:ATP-dependent protease ClpP protease subunit